VLEIGELTTPTAGVAPVTLAQQMDKVEKALIEQALRNHQGRMPKVMESLGIAKKTLYDKLHRHDIDADKFRPN
jgi:DNA-binding NtrC family response regulator